MHQRPVRLRPYKPPNAPTHSSLVGLVRNEHTDWVTPDGHLIGSLPSGLIQNSARNSVPYCPLMSPTLPCLART